jgi:hypothetical protein
MKFSSLPADIILSVHSYIEIEDAHSLCQASRACSRYGWIHSISFNGSKSPSYATFIRLCDRHRHTLTKIRVFGLRDPLLWLPDWYTNVEFIDCTGDLVLSRIQQPGVGKIDRHINLKEIRDGNVIVNEKFIGVPLLSCILHKKPVCT